MQRRREHRTKPDRNKHKRDYASFDHRYASAERSHNPRFRATRFRQGKRSVQWRRSRRRLTRRRSRV